MTEPRHPMLMMRADLRTLLMVTDPMNGEEEEELEERVLVGVGRVSSSSSSSRKVSNTVSSGTVSEMERLPAFRFFIVHASKSFRCSSETTVHSGTSRMTEGKLINIVKFEGVWV